MLAEDADGLLGRVLGRIEESEVAEEYEAGLVGGGEALLVIGVLAVGDREHAEALPRQALVLLEDVLAEHVDEGQHVLVDLVAVAGLEDRLDRALADEDVVALVLDDHRHALADEIEGYLVDLAAGALDVEVLVGQDREVEEVAQPRLVVAVHPRVAEDVLARPVRHVDVALEGHLVLGDRAGLVGAKDVHGAEVLDRL